MKKYKIIIFDLDDTLIDNTKCMRQAYKKTIESIGQNFSESEFQRFLEVDKKFWIDWLDGLITLPNNLKDEEGRKSEAFTNWLRAQRFLIYFNNEISLEEAIKLNNLYMNLLTEKIIAIDGAREVLEYLKDKYHITVATNGPQVATKGKLSKIDCLNLINEVLSADMFGYMKPRKEFFEGIQKLLNNFNSDDYLMIGDSLKCDIGFGMNCKFDSIWFNWKNEKLTEEYKPTMIISNLRELKKLL